MPDILRKYEDMGYHSWYEDTGVLVLWNTDLGDGYSWKEVALLAKKSGDRWLFMPYSDSGCSCNSPYEDKPNDSWDFRPYLLEAEASTINLIREYVYDPAERIGIIDSLRRSVNSLSL